MHPTAPTRRRFQFGLGTMFVLVTVVCGLLGLRYALTYERHAALQWALSHGVSGEFEMGLRPRPSLAWWIRALGEPSHTVIPVSDQPGDERDDYLRQLDELRRIFPEAKIIDLSRWAPSLQEMD